MTIPLDEQPLIVLADDDAHSARLLVRTLAQLGARQVKWHGDASRSLRQLTKAFAGDPAHWPAIVVVDLKANSTATLDFIRQLAPIVPTSVPVVAMAPTLERGVREALLDAGARAVFERHAGLTAYQEEIGNLVGFLDRHMLQRFRRDLARLPRRAGRLDIEFLADSDLAIIEESAGLPRTGTG